MNNEYPKVSVIVPVLNAEKTLAACLNSLITQSYPDFEVIIVNNNSGDNTKEIISEYTAKYSNIHEVIESKRGRGRARNRGIEDAKEEIICMTDADCIAPVNWLKNIVTPIIEKKAKVVVGFQKDLVNNYWTRQRHLADWEFIKTKITGNFVNHLDTKNFACRGDILKKLRFDDSLIAYEDWDLFIRLKKEDENIFFLPDLQVGHFHDSSLLELAKTQYERGKNLAIILKKYRNDSFFQENFKDFESAKSIKIRNFILFIPWTIYQLLFHTKKAPFRITSDASWKLGVIKANMKRNI